MAEVGAGAAEPLRTLMPFGVVVADVAMVPSFCGDDSKFGRLGRELGNSLDVAYSRFRLGSRHLVVRSWNRQKVERPAGSASRLNLIKSYKCDRLDYN